MAKTLETLVGNEIVHGESIAKSADEAPTMLVGTAENSIKIAVTTQDVPEIPVVNMHSNKVAMVVLGNHDPNVLREIVPPTNEIAKRTEGVGSNPDETETLKNLIENGFYPGKNIAQGTDNAVPGKTSKNNIKTVMAAENVPESPIMGGRLNKVTATGVLGDDDINPAVPMEIVLPMKETTRITRVVGLNLDDIETPKNLVGNELCPGESTSLALGIHNVVPKAPAETDENATKLLVATEDVRQSPATNEPSIKAAVGGSGTDDLAVPMEMVPPTYETMSRRVGAVLSLDETWGKATAKNSRKTMEDFVCIKPGFIAGSCDAIGGCIAPPDDHVHHRPDANYFAVFDGHGGSEVSNYCADNLHDNLAQEWKEAIDKDGWKHRWEAAILSTYERADGAFKDGRHAPESAGSTAVVVVLSACQIIVGNCGDSRAVLCRANEAIPLTVDHKPNREDELKRITDAGGKILYTDCERVEGILSMTRAIGDHFLKPWVIPVPEVTFMTRSEDDQFIIMASDGLWNVMTNEEAVAFARLALRRLQKLAMISYDRPAKAVAKSLLARAIKKGSNDNISVIFIDLSVPRRRKKPHKEPEANQA